MYLENKNLIIRSATVEDAQILLDTNLKNTRAQHVYEKLGFQKTAVHGNSWKNQLGERQSSIAYELSKEEYEGRLL